MSGKCIFTYFIHRTVLLKTVCEYFILLFDCIVSLVLSKQVTVRLFLYRKVSSLHSY